MAWLRGALAWAWTGLKFVGRWLGPALLGVAAYTFYFPPAPFDELSIIPALAGGVLSAVAWLFARKSERSWIPGVLAACAFASFAYTGWRHWDEARGYHEVAVSFENRGARLAGTLYLPDRPGRVPGIVWVHGSGAETRSFSGKFARHYARAGYAVLAYDKRGAGESTGRLVQGIREIDPANIDLLASDAAAALSWLATRSEVRADAIGLSGVSQAGHIVPRAAAMSGHAAFLLLLTASTTSTYSQMRYERFHIGPPVPDGEMPTLSQILDAYGRGHIPDGMTPDQAAERAESTNIDLPYGDYDPVTDLSALNIPGLWVLGDNDWMVPSGPTARRIDELRALGMPYEYRHIPGAMHAFLVGPRAPVLSTIDTWLARVTAEAP